MTLAVGIDLGGTKIAAGVVDVEGRVHARDEVPSDLDDPKGLRARVGELLDRLGSRAEWIGVGVGAAGLIDFGAGRYLYGPNTGLRDVDMASELTEATGLPVRVDNDANVAAWAEHRFGSGRGTRDFLCITLGTGVGGGIVAGGRPYRGAHGGAAEIGHMLVDPAGPVCGCGRRGCWEQYASGSALERMAAEGLSGEPDSVLHARTGGDPARVEGRMITDAAREGDAFAVRIVHELARWVGWGLASLVNILEPERIAVGGGLASDWDLLEATATRSMLERVEAPEYRPMPDVVRAELGAEAGVVGAALLVLDQPV